MVSLADLKKNSQKNLEKLVKQTKELSGGGQKREVDPRYWYPEVDNAGNGRAVIRFLPAAKVDGEDGRSFVRYFSHGFQGPTGKWYINNSLTTLGQKDPVAELNNYLWNTVGTEEAKEQARKQKRSVNYVANILVVKDPANPENEGKVFLYRFGPKIWSKIEQQIAPDAELGEEPCDVFDFWSGKNFKLVIKNVAGYRNYDSSEFLSSSAISDDDSEIERIWGEAHSLLEIIDPKNFKSYDELKAELDRALGVAEDTGSQTYKPAAYEKPTAAKELVERPAANKPQEAPKAANVDLSEDFDLDADFDIEALLKD